MATYNGNGQDNQITGSNLADQIYGRNGNDILDGGDGNDLLDGGNDHDILYGGQGQDTLNGGSGNDNLFGGAGDDVLIGGLGQDWATYTGGGAIVANLNTGIVTGQGTDSLSGIENIFGSAFNDILQGNASANKLSGGDGDDRIIVSYGYDELTGGAGVDTLDFQNTGAVQVSLTQGTYYMNTTNGGTATGFETVRGSNGHDVIVGDNVANILEGRGGNDTINGQGGDDVLIANGGNDIMTGGLGFDTFTVATGSGNIVISDFTSGSDRIDLSHYFDQNGNSPVWSGTATQSGANTVLSLTGGGQSVNITLNNVAAASLTANDFINGSAGLLPVPYVPTADVFLVTPHANIQHDVQIIHQFDDGLDLIDISAMGYVFDPSYNDYFSPDWVSDWEQQGNDLVITFYNTTNTSYQGMQTLTLVVENAQIGQFDGSDFLF